MSTTLAVWYEEWQMACCGSWFALGSRVVWPVTQHSDFESGFLSPGMERETGRVDYVYDMHFEHWEDIYTLTGTIQSIQGVYFYFKPDPKDAHFLRRASGFLVGMADCDYWTKEREAPKKRRSARKPRAQFDAYLLKIVPEEIRPARESDKYLFT